MATIAETTEQKVLDVSMVIALISHQIKQQDSLREFYQLMHGKEGDAKLTQSDNPEFKRQLEQARDILSEAMINDSQPASTFVHMGYILKDNQDSCPTIKNKLQHYTYKREELTNHFQGKTHQYIIVVHNWQNVEDLEEVMERLKEDLEYVGLEIESRYTTIHNQ